MRNEARAARRLCGLYAVTPEAPDTRWLAARVEECIAGGAALVQYRAKNASAGLALEQARRLAAVCRAAGVPLIVNDSIDLAIAAGADGVHLGRDDAGVASARAAFPTAIIGVSCYADAGRARAAALAGADYIAVGSMFASSTKPAAQRASLEILKAAKEVSALPVAAIGGITLDNAPRLVAAGADLVAVIAALFEAADVRGAARSFASLFAQVPEGNVDLRAQPRAF